MLSQQQRKGHSEALSREFVNSFKHFPVYISTHIQSVKGHAVA
jgi:hypothetical protein